MYSVPGRVLGTVYTGVVVADQGRGMPVVSRAVSFFFVSRRLVGSGRGVGARQGKATRRGRVRRAEGDAGPGGVGRKGGWDLREARGKGVVVRLGRDRD